jgi:hypothetical protein
MWCQDRLDVGHDAQSDCADFAVGDAAHRSGRRGNIANDGLGAIEAADFGGGVHRNQRKRGAGLKLG